MKEDILEEIVDKYFQLKGYFTTHNVKYRPSKDHPDYVSRSDSVHSDIDVLAIHPKKRGKDRVWAVNCKSWQGGFGVEGWLKNIESDKVVSGRRSWRFFRELTREKWGEAFVESVKSKTGTSEFTHVTAVTKFWGDKSKWENNTQFKKAIKDNRIVLIDFNTMYKEIREKLGTTVASSQLGRLIQVIKASETA